MYKRQAANGFLLTVLCFIAQAVTLWLQPLLRSYLAISMACGISSRKRLFEGCTLTGRLLRQAIGWARKAFAALMSIQRVVTVQLDRSASRLGQLLTGDVYKRQLREYLNERGGKLSSRETVHFISQILKALEHAHANGVVHREDVYKRQTSIMATTTAP